MFYYIHQIKGAKPNFANIHQVEKWAYRSPDEKWVIKLMVTSFWVLISFSSIWPKNHHSRYSHKGNGMMRLDDSNSVVYIKLFKDQ